MNKRTRQGNINTSGCDDDDEHNQTKKFQRVSSCFVPINDTERCSITQLEGLSNEVFYEIFEYLDAYHIYRAFIHLNTRFQNLIRCSDVAISINTVSLSKSSFQSYYTDYIIPNKHRIHSLHLSNPFIIDLFSSSTEDISQYLQLETLILYDAPPNRIVDLLNSLSSLRSFTSLSIRICHNPNKMNIYHLIFALPALKYCKISFSQHIQLGQLPMCKKTSSPIEHLVITGSFNLNELSAVLSYVPQLRRLLVESITNGSINKKIENCSFVLNHLISVSLTLHTLHPENLEQFLEHHFSQVQILNISTISMSYYSDIKRWEQLLSSHLPYLRIFDFHNGMCPCSGVICSTNQIVFPQFNSSFFSQKNWFFTHEFTHKDLRDLNRVIYSSQPYRRKYFILSNKLDGDTNVDQQKILFDSVRHLIIHDENIILNSSKYFPNVNELTLGDRCSLLSEWYASDDFRCILPLTQLTKLTINNTFSNFAQIVDMLRLMPNIHTLTFPSINLSMENLKSLKQSETFRLVSKQNKINNITFNYPCSIGTVKLLMNSFSGLQHLTLRRPAPILDASIPSLLSATTCQLSSLCMFPMEKKRMEKLKTLIQSEKVSTDYSIKVINDRFYLWWGY